MSKTNIKNTANTLKILQTNHLYDEKSRKVKLTVYQTLSLLVWKRKFNTFRAISFFFQLQSEKNDKFSFHKHEDVIHSWKVENK